MLYRIMVQQLVKFACNYYSYNSLKENYIYHIVRDQSMSRAEKLRKIRAFAPDYGNVDYIKSIIMILKEKVSARLR